MAADRSMIGSGLIPPGTISKIRPPSTPAPPRGPLQAVAMPNTAADSRKMPPPAFKPAQKTKVPRQTLAERAGSFAAKTRPQSYHESSNGRTNGIPSRSQTPSLAKPGSISRPSSAMSGPNSRPASAMSYGRPIPDPDAPGLGMRPQTSDGEAGEDDTKKLFNLPKRQGWDTKAKLQDHEQKLSELHDFMSVWQEERSSMREKLASLERKDIQAETQRVTLESQLAQKNIQSDGYLKRAQEAERMLDDERRKFNNDREDAARRSRIDIDEMRRRHQNEIEELRKKNQNELETIEMKLRRELMDEKAARTAEVRELKAATLLEKQSLEMQISGSGGEMRELKVTLELTKKDLERERSLTSSLRDNLQEQGTQALTLDTSIRSLKSRIEQLESEVGSQQESSQDLEKQLEAAREKAVLAEEKLRAEELIRRKLHNQVQELKGNIRVFCRVRPTLSHESTSAAQITYPDETLEGREISVIGATEKTAMGAEVTKTHPFAFDKVFGPRAGNSDVFEEISQLVQSALDGYNVCIFCYGQTGSGKTYTMSSTDGMIPLAVHQIYQNAEELREKGWTYTMTGSFVEVYNENINDLLGKADDLDRKKHEIRHDAKTSTTTITDVEVVPLDSPDTVDTLLQRASKTRSVAATKANERSSRSHSVFILRLTGTNTSTGASCTGTLNLVDLAGSERLSHSGATGDRLKETQSINRSLACLGDVIAALGNGKDGAHIPYRNSKLTYLLQYSLGGNSKALMFVMCSPMREHLGETLTSLKFATKVNSTVVGTAKRSGKAS